MKLLFRPDKFIDEKGKEIELKDIELEYIKGEGCTACDYACGYAKLEVSLCRNKPNSYISFEVHEWEDIQQEVEKIWNASLAIGEEPFNRIGQPTKL